MTLIMWYQDVNTDEQLQKTIKKLDDASAISLEIWDLWQAKGGIMHAIDYLSATTPMSKKILKAFVFLMMSIT